MKFSYFLFLFYTKYMYFFQISYQQDANNKENTTSRASKPPDRLKQRALQNLDLNKLNTYQWCLCRREIPGSTMIACDSGNCQLEWFHLRCVGLGKVPRGKWCCQTCLAN